MSLPARLLKGSNSNAPIPNVQVSNITGHYAYFDNIQGGTGGSFSLQNITCDTLLANTGVYSYAINTNILTAITGVSAPEIFSTTLASDNIFCSNFTGDNGYFRNLFVDDSLIIPDIVTANTGSFNGITANFGRITTLTGTNLLYENLNGNYSNFINATGTNAFITNISGTNAFITNITGNSGSFNLMRIGIINNRPNIVTPGAASLYMSRGTPGVYLDVSSLLTADRVYGLRVDSDADFVMSAGNQTITGTKTFTTANTTNSTITNFRGTTITGTNIYSNLISSAIGQFTDLNGVNILSTNANITDTTITNLKATTFTGTDVFIANIKSQPFFNTSGPQMKIKRIVNSFGYLIDGSLSNGTSPAADRTITFPDPGMNCDFVLSTGTQLLTVATVNTTNSTITNLRTTTITGASLSLSGNLVLSTGGTPLLWNETGTFTMTGSGAMTGTYPGFFYKKIDNVVSLQMPTLVGSINAATTLNLNTLPIPLRPKIKNITPALIVNNGSSAFGYYEVNTGGVISSYSSANGGDFTTNFTLYGTTLTYITN